MAEAAMEVLNKKFDQLHAEAVRDRDHMLQQNNKFDQFRSEAQKDKEHVLRQLKEAATEIKRLNENIPLSKQTH